MRNEKEKNQKDLIDLKGDGCKMFRVELENIMEVGG